MNNTNTTTRKTTTATAPDFETVKRAFEEGHAAGGDFSAALLDLSTAVTYSVLNKCIDPQRKTAATREAISDNGHNPALLAVKRGIAFDRRLLDNTAANANAATRSTFNAAGDMVTETADRDAAAALASLIDETLSDGIDLVQTAALALLEQAAEHAAAPGWLDTPFTARRLSKKVYIQSADSAAYADVDATPIQEVYKAVRRAVQDSRAVQTDPRNGYTYIEDLTVDGLDATYHRLGKYSDLGGYNTDGHYTADRQTVQDYETTLERLELTTRQAQIIRLRMQGKGYKAIATYLGVTQRAIAKTVEQVQKKAAAIGLTPAG